MPFHDCLGFAAPTLALSASAVASRYLCAVTAVLHSHPRYFGLSVLRSAREKQGDLHAEAPVVGSVVGGFGPIADAAADLDELITELE